MKIPEIVFDILAFTILASVVIFIIFISPIVIIVFGGVSLFTWALIHFMKKGL